MILLTLKTNDIKKEKVNPSAYAKAWFRLQNEDTNQTLDYSYIKDVLEKEGIEDDEEAVDAGDEDEEEDAEQSERIEQTILCGRIFNIANKSKEVDAA